MGAFVNLRISFFGGFMRSRYLLPLLASSVLSQVGFALDPFGINSTFPEYSLGRRALRMGRLTKNHNKNKLARASRRINRK
jgi:hypothetical protein